MRYKILFKIYIIIIFSINNNNIIEENRKSDFLIKIYQGKYNF